MIDRVLESPEQEVREHGDGVSYQQRATIYQKESLVSVMVNVAVTTPRVVAAYRTNKPTMCRSRCVGVSHQVRLEPCIKPNP